jgi:hypothetical protein
MNRTYFGMLFIIISGIIYFSAEYFFGEMKVMENLRTFLVIWILIAYQVGQYSMKFPKQ